MEESMNLNVDIRSDSAHNVDVCANTIMHHVCP